MAGRVPVFVQECVCEYEGMWVGLKVCLWVSCVPPDLHTSSLPLPGYVTNTFLPMLGVAAVVAAIVMVEEVTDRY